MCVVCYTHQICCMKHTASVCVCVCVRMCVRVVCRSMCVQIYNYIRIHKSNFVHKIHCSTVQRSSTLQNTAEHQSTPQHTVAHCNTPQYTATHHTTLQHIAPHTARRARHSPAYRRNISTPTRLQHAASHSNTQQHTATHTTPCASSTQRAAPGITPYTETAYQCPYTSCQTADSLRRYQN